MAISGFLYMFGKITLALVSGQRQDVRWLANWALCGAVDGICTSSWYVLVQSVADKLEVNKASKTVLMMCGTSCLWTPAYVGGFLFLLSLLEDKGFRGAALRVRSDYIEMLWNTTKTWAPFNAFLFGCVPPHLRLVVSMTWHYLFLVSLALWDFRVNPVSKPRVSGGFESY